MDLVEKKVCEDNVPYDAVDNGVTKDMPEYKNEEYISIKYGFLEHLLNCLANQKFVNEPPQNGDSLAVGKDEYYKVQSEIQQAIDKAYHLGHFLLRVEKYKSELYEKLDQNITQFWNDHIDYIIEQINISTNGVIEEVKSDVSFKWQHLVWQEMWMYCRLSCFKNAVINEERLIVTPGQVEREDFDAICARRGFSDAQRSFLIESLKHVGIGDNL